MNVLFEDYPIATIQMYNVSARPDLIPVMQRYLPSAQTYPQIIIDDVYVGGYTDLLHYRKK